ncbi:ABC transporter ATP-binding protein [Aggregatilinea lenta]|uniref:ABC transporter ATP-binding protein n=1 Tax=Aggregatilinea lenta TaxID=913108 RepID=UPI000E5BF588|nr:ABC transporter ATP-binding protein [Aggregatilinea lenta]
MPLLEVRNITKRFGGLVAVNDLSLSVNQGEILGMIGPNGAGKTTAFNMISGYYKPDEGQVIFNGQNITKRRPDQICKLGLTRTFQVVKPFPQLSVLDNVIVGAYNRTNNKQEAQQKAHETLEFLRMGSMSEQLAGGLSVAGRKRLEIAKVLATGPKMILLDEAMAGLRPKETDEMIELVRQISQQGIALLLVEHVMKVIMSLADRIVVIYQGEKIAEGEPQAVVQNRAVIDAYLGEEAAHAAS